MAIHTQNNLRALLFVLIFVSVGTAILFVTHAATNTSSVETESGTLAGTASIVSDSSASGAQAIRFGTAPLGSGVLPIPSPLSSNWVAPSGNYTMPAQTVNVSGTVTVNLTAATITGTTGYLFSLTPGSNLTIIGGTLSGTIQGLVQDNIVDGATATVSIAGTKMTNVRTVVFAKTQGGPVSITLTNVVATGLGSGVRATSDYMDIENCTLTGGGVPPTGNPAGVHSLDDNAGNIDVPGSFLKVFNSTITGYTSTGFQGDSVLGETRVHSADIENNVLGHNSDSGGIDSKMHSVIVKNNTIYSDGGRAISSHYGTLTASGNTIYQVATSNNGVGKAYQGTGTLIVSNDVVVLTPGANLAIADVVLSPGSGPPASYPRVGNLTLTHITNQAGTVLLGPTKVNPAGGFTPTITVNP